MGSVAFLSSTNLLFIFPDLQAIMGLWFVRNSSRRSLPQDAITEVDVPTDGEKKNEIPTGAGVLPNKEDVEVPTEDLQQGVKNVEAVTLSWTRTMLIAVFVK